MNTINKTNSGNEISSRLFGIFLIFFFSLLISKQVHAFEFITDVSKIHPSNPGHDKLTDLAYQCLNKYNGNEPQNCLSGLPEIIDRGIDADTYISTSPLTSSLKLPFTIEELTSGVIWPDDPTRQVKYSTFLKPSVNYLLGCGSHKNSIEGGLYCNSHFGSLQFFHSMASTETEKYEETRQKILSWAWFTYGISTNKINLNQNYCEYFYDLYEKTSKRKLFAKSFLLNTDKNKKNKQLHCSNNNKLAFIYNNSCKNPFNSKTCEVVYDSKELYMAALGAVLHLVQDSYAQAHANRNSCAINSITRHPEPAAYINCTESKGYFNYANQSGSLHGISDKFPVKVDASCLLDTTLKTTKIHDPVTASAKVLWFALNNASPEKLEEYLDSHVFRQSDTRYDASPGSCYIETYEVTEEDYE